MRQNQYIKYSVSKRLLQKTHQAYNEKYNITRFYFYFKPGMNYDFIGNRVCCLIDEIPDHYFETI